VYFFNNVIVHLSRPIDWGDKINDARAGFVFFYAFDYPAAIADKKELSSRV
jgi:hypothetical protein